MNSVSRAKHGMAVTAHATAEVLLLFLAALGFQIVQNFVLIPFASKAELHTEDLMRYLPLSWVQQLPSRHLLTEEALPYWRFSSFLIWLCFGYGSSFILHLPSSWKKRIQLTKTFTALNEDWYATQKRPIWFPSGFFFPLLWIPVKCIRAIGHAILWEKVGRVAYSAPTMLVLVSLVLGNLWNQVVFVQHDLKGGVGVLAAQFAVMGSLVLYCLFELPSIAKFFIPYTISVFVGIWLNVSLMVENRETAE